MSENVIPKYIEKECAKHGLCKYVLEGRGHYRCVKCRVHNVTLRRRKLKEQLVEYKGGKCEMCGYNKCIAALEFHHKDHNQKDYGLSNKGFLHNFEKAKKEVDKCILICSNCHREVHYEEGFLYNA